MVEGVAETILSGIDPIVLERVQAQPAEAETSEKSVEQKQMPVQRQESSRQPQKQKGKRRDRGMEL